MPYKITTKRRRAFFTRYGVTVMVHRDGRFVGQRHSYGNDGRKVRARAIQWAKQWIKDGCPRAWEYQ